MNWGVTAVIAVAAIALLVLFGVWLNNSLKSEKITDKHAVRDEIRRSVKTSTLKCFLPPKVFAFYNAFTRALPSDYIIIPNVSAELLFVAGQRKDLRMWGHYADVVVFTKSYKPVFVVDLVDPSGASAIAKAMDKEIFNIIKNAGINVLQYPVQNNYNIDDLRKAVAKTMKTVYNQ